MTLINLHSAFQPSLLLDVPGEHALEACGIEVIGENKWITLIQNASIDSEHQRNNDANRLK